ncbi:MULTISPECIES: hypothetical protein [unclassified Lysobacter]|uniref:hypothetical protein n=1 Tax=unclassified Lysobacter TaxID=2635362 RepID=UPI000701E2E9|nr:MULTISPECIES: hypothetical protein [unclassified Lysobacter]KQZ60139.1 hypothetical protein ASD53_03000 [Lysobacter sp. Root559]KRC38580.1 hypothetical protein ASE10_03315 [Lysobacter sp. Root76]KRD71218.1 hypothetical protein ASE45_05135 [Lysobacter sp. Root96]
MIRNRSPGKLAGFLGALLGAFGWVVISDRTITVLQNNGGSYGSAGMAAAVCILVAAAALALGMCFGSRWRQVRVETTGALLGLTAALALVLGVRYGA